ncbi:GNAT family N-acetyltransferase [Methylomarinum sp. Ch1-1]|uniref:GNAT family N-acetyltransferase n=1 Tax=Methylomarinum roseum TaxID=3067653 RepID=A0AAU7NSN1_9GAMM|nr:GNAT family N-acetyltransferase [Methylomarinum sp. Ch1-1]MDP4520012.1 GNAT family N-acetyltransferase [Methylomarinum sp. Ch1-1]
MVPSKQNTGKFSIRKATETDLPVLVDFLAKLALHVAGAPPHTLKIEERERLMDALRSSLSDPDKLIVVAESTSTRLVGMGYLYAWRNQGIWEQAGDVELKSGIIDDVWVEPDFRKIGVFSAILRELVAFAESHDIDELVLEYAVSNQEAAATWTRLGFKPTGVRAAAFTTNVRNALAKRQRIRNLQSGSIEQPKGN